MSAQTLCFANSAVRLEWEGEEIGQLVRRMFLDSAAEDYAAPAAILHLSAGSEPKTYNLWTNDPAAKIQGTLGEIAVHLMDRVCYHLADRSQGGGVFHAACLSRGGKAWLIPGSSGAGKSTLAVWLASQGFSLLTDELVYIPTGSLACQAFTRPVHLKRPSADLLPEWIDEKALPTGAGWLILPERFSASIQDSPVPIQRILFPGYRPGVDFRLGRLSRADAALRLTSVLVNARNLPDHGFPELVRLARDLPAYQLTYSQLDQLVGLQEFFE